MSVRNEARTHQADVTSALNAILSQRRDGDHDQLHRLLTIRQIMTPRSEFRCAVGGETADAAFARIPFVFDEIPVVEGEDPDDATAKIVGMLRRRDVPHHRYRDKIDDHLDEAPADAPLAPDITILDYARSAPNYPVALVGEPGRITGLVTLWDLERLPVRIALFAHIVDFEERMGWLIHEFGARPVGLAEHGDGSPRTSSPRRGHPARGRTGPYWGADPCHRLQRKARTPEGAAPEIETLSPLCEHCWSIRVPQRRCPRRALSRCLPYPGLPRPDRRPDRLHRPTGTV